MESIKFDKSENVWYNIYVIKKKRKFIQRLNQQLTYMAPSSSGLGHEVFALKTGVQISVVSPPTLIVGSFLSLRRQKHPYKNEEPIAVGAFVAATRIKFPSGRY